MRFLRFCVCCFFNDSTHKGLLEILGEQTHKIAQTVCFLKNCGNVRPILAQVRQLAAFFPCFSVSEAENLHYI